MKQMPVSVPCPQQVCMLCHRIHLACPFPCIFVHYVESAETWGVLLQLGLYHMKHGAPADGSSSLQHDVLKPQLATTCGAGGTLKPGLWSFVSLVLAQGVSSLRGDVRTFPVQCFEIFAVSILQLSRSI